MKHSIWGLIALLIMLDGSAQADPLLFEEKPIVIIIPSYNNNVPVPNDKNKDCFYKKNLDSIFMQDYSNYRVIYIDDCSTDGTPDLVETYIKKCGFEDKVTLIKNKKNCGALANLYRAIHACNDDEIIVTMDGDDWFKPGVQALQVINAAYQDPNVLMTYGNYQEWPSGNKSICKPIGANIVRAAAHREWEWVTSHVRTFYAGLFKQIKLQDLIEPGRFFPVTWDMAFMFPMLEMAHGRHKFIEKVLYEYNCASPLNDFKTKLQYQLHLNYAIRAKKKYAPLEWPLPPAPLHEPSLDVVIFAGVDPVVTQNCIAKVKTNIKADARVIVFVDGDVPLVAGFDYDQVDFVINDSRNFKSNILEVLAYSAHSYVLFIHDNMFFNQSSNCSWCIKKMEATKAHAFHLGLGKESRHHPQVVNPVKIPEFIELGEDFLAWQYKWVTRMWADCYQFGSIYRKKDIVEMIENLAFTNVIDFERAWSCERADLDMVGLCFAKTCLE